MQSKATTVQQYLAGLEPDRRAAIQAVREVILKNLDKDFEEGMQYGMISYHVPHRVFPDGYHCDPKQPLPFASLASQKNHMAIYLCSIYGDQGEATEFCRAWEKTGKKLDMGQSCIRFKKVEDLALDVIGDAIRRMPVKKYIAYYENAIRTMRRRASDRAATRKKAAPPARAAAAKRTTAQHTSPTARAAKASRGGR